MHCIYAGLVPLHVLYVPSVPHMPFVPLTVFLILCGSTGMNTAGYRVIQTVGSELAAIDFQRGFCINFASTLTGEEIAVHHIQHALCIIQ
jgi:phosphate/sulfate permease